LRKVESDEGKVEAAHKESRHQQQVGAILERHAQSPADGGGAGCVGRRCGLLGTPWQGKGAQSDRDGDHGQDLQGRLPGQAFDHRLGRRHENKLPDRTAGGNDAAIEPALFRRRGAHDRAQHHRHATAGEADADQHAAADPEHQLRLRFAHQPDAGHISNATEERDPDRTLGVGDRAGEGLERTPQQVLDGPGERQRRDAPAQFGMKRRQE
jgi:hypothetical protein